MQTALEKQNAALIAKCEKTLPPKVTHVDRRWLWAQRWERLFGPREKNETLD